MAKTWLEHIKISMFGTLGTTNAGASAPVEIWSCGLRFYSPTNIVPTPADLASIGVQTINNIKKWFTSGGAIISPTAQLGGIKVIYVTNTGKQRDVNTVVVDAPPNTFGTGTSGSPIWEQSYALTFRTAIQRGRGHSGRIYPPLSGSQPDIGSPYCPANDASAMATAGALLLRDTENGIQNGFGHTVDFYAAVMSTGDTAGTGIAPLATKITGVACDRVADIQHRRTNKVPRAEGVLAPIPA